MGKAGNTIRKFSQEEVIDRTSKAIRKVALDLFAAFLRGTPVDKGRAREGWIPSIGIPAHGEPGGTSAAGAVGIIQKFEAGKSSSVWLANNVPYIGALEDGHSDQAPNGIVGPVIGEASQILQSALRSV